jgi:3-methyladenine DNA glycosylase AlkD
MTKNHMVWSVKWVNYINQHLYEDAISLLNLQAGENRGTPNTKVKGKAITLTLEHLNQAELFNAACQFAMLSHPTAKEIAAYLLIKVYHQNPTEVMEKLSMLADDENWEVREWAASACGEQLANDFDHFYPEMANWVKAESANVRRAAALSVKYACKTKRAEWANPLLDLIEPLLTDSDPYIKKNLGPFTIGDAMLRAFPVETLNRLNKWIHLDNIHARWNIVKAFSTAQGAKVAENAIPILSILISDERTEIQRAVKSAMNNLKNRQPAVYQQLLKEGSL